MSFDGKLRETLRRTIEKAKKQRDVLRAFDLDAAIKSGLLTPIGRGPWYEVAENVRDLPKALGILGQGMEITQSGKTRVKLANPERLLKGLEKLAAQKLP